MGKIIENMNFNYYDKNSSNLAQTLLEIYKLSFNNGTYLKMTEVFEREIPSSKCFNDGNHNDLDHVINFCATMKKNIAVSVQDDMVMEENKNSFGRAM